MRIALFGLLATAAIAFAIWLASLPRRDVSLVDRAWSWMVAAPALVVAASVPAVPPAAVWMLAILLAWAIRLSIYVSARNWGHGEDRRYAAIRARNGPRFPYASLVTVFALQAVLAWLVAMPAVAALLAGPTAAWPALGAAGLLIAAAGVVIEAVADAQMAAYRRARRAAPAAKPAVMDAVMDRGLWRWSRHPNYFGEACVWWGFWLAALGIGGLATAWSIVSPLIMTVLLWRISGVALLERDLLERRPAYRDYIARTSALVPWPPRPTLRSDPP